MLFDSIVYDLKEKLEKMINPEKDLPFSMVYTAVERYLTYIALRITYLVSRSFYTVYGSHHQTEE